MLAFECAAPHTSALRAAKMGRIGDRRRGFYCRGKRAKQKLPSFCFRAALTTKPITLSRTVPSSWPRLRSLITALSFLYFICPSHNGSMTPDSLQFHIRSEDLFGTLATVLDLLRQDAARGYGPKHDAALRRFCDDLILLQSGCRIVEQPGHLSPPRRRRTRARRAVE